MNRVSTNARFNDDCLRVLYNWNHIHIFNEIVLAVLLHLFYKNKFEELKEFEKL